MDNIVSSTNSVPQQTEQKFNIELNLQELNTVIAGLQELPHRVVDAVLRKIIAQAQEQAQKQNS